MITASYLVCSQNVELLNRGIYQAVCRLVLFSRCSHYYLFPIRALSWFYVPYLQSCTSETRVSEILPETVSEWPNAAQYSDLISRRNVFTLAWCYRVWFNKSYGLPWRCWELDMCIICYFRYNFESLCAFQWLFRVVLVFWKLILSEWESSTWMKKILGQNFAAAGLLILYSFYSSPFLGWKLKLLISTDKTEDGWKQKQLSVG